jgi:transposase-like protein
VIRTQYDAAKAALERSGRPLTQAAIAEQLGIGDRTLREWRKRFELE